MLLRNDRAYLVAGWWPPECKDADERVKEIMESIDLFTPEGGIEPLTEQQAEARGFLLNELGIEEYAGGKYPAAAKYFEAALDYSVDPDMIENLVNTYFEDKRISEAESTLDKYIGILPGNFKLLSLKAALYRQQENFDESKEIYSKLFEQGYDNEEDLLSYLTMVAADEEYEQAIEVLQRFTSNHPSVQAKRWLATMHGRNGDHDVAIKQMLAITVKDKSNLDNLYALAEVYELAGKHGQAVSVSDRIIKADPEDVSVYLLKGRNEFELKQYLAAQSSFDRLLEKYPENEEANHYRQYLAALLGKGDRSQISKVLEPVTLPDVVQKKMDLAEAREVNENENEYDTIDIYKVIGISYEKGEHRRVTTFRKYKVNTLSGVDALSTLTRSFDPLFEQLYVNRLAVYDEAGELVAEGSPADYYVLDDSGTGQASQDRRVHMPVPNLKPGYTVELAVTLEELSAPDSFSYEDNFLVALNPMRLGVVFFHGDRSGIQSYASRVEVQEVGSSLQVWSVEFPEVFELEANQASWEDFLPYVRISGAGLSWEQVGLEYLDRISPKLKLDPETEALARKLINGLSDVNEKVAELTKYVQAECTYKAIEFGVRSQVPNAAAEVRRNGYGDCKDHSVFLFQLLKAAGIDAHLALINSSGRVTESLPSMSQFNHMIVCVSAKEGTLFLDATEKFTTPIVPKTPGLEGKFALVLDPKKPYLKRTPGYDSAVGKVEINRQVTIKREPEAETAALEVREKLLLNPYCSRGLREYLQAYASRDRRTAVRDLVREVEKVRIKKLVVENLDEPTKNLVLNLEYSVPNALSLIGSKSGMQRYVGNMPAIWEYYVLEVSADENRVTPLELKLPMSVTSKTEFRLPQDYELLNPQQLSRQGKSKFMQWTTRLVEADERLIFESSLRRNAGSFAPQEFEQYWQASQAAVSALGSAIRLGKQGLVSN